MINDLKGNNTFDHNDIPFYRKLIKQLRTLLEMYLLFFFNYIVGKKIDDAVGRNYDNMLQMYNICMNPNGGFYIK